MSNVTLNGHCDPKFTRVADAFLANFETHGEIGGRVCLIKEGETVIDLWAGHTDQEKTRPWCDDTLICCMSVTKGVVALASHILHTRGLLDYDAPVASYWPEFGAAGKAELSVRQALAHQTSLAMIDKATPGDVSNWDVFVSKIAAQEPNWPPGTNETYHSVTFGYIIGEIIQRIDGRSLNQFVREELAEPLGADFHLGCSDEVMSRVIPHIFNPDNELMAGGLINENTAKQFAPMPEGGDLSEGLRLGFPSGGGVSHAEGIARLFAPLSMGGRYNGTQFYSDTTLQLMAEQHWYHDDSMFGNDFRVALGLLLHTRFNDWGRDGNIGTAGAGGYSAFADPSNRLAYGFTPARFTTGYGLGIEHANLVAAVYAGDL